MSVDEAPKVETPGGDVPAIDVAAVDAPTRAPMLSPSARTHLLIVCVALLVAGILVPWLVPGVSLWWGVGAVAIGSHVGLVLVAGGAMIGWIGRRFS